MSQRFDSLCWPSSTLISSQGTAQAAVVCSWNLSVHSCPPREDPTNTIPRVSSTIAY